MKAAVYHGPRDIRLEEVKVPEINENEVLLRVHSCGICGSDLHMYRQGMFDKALGRPIKNGRIMGHEMSGEIFKIGQEVDGFKIGDRITTVGLGGFAEFVPIAINERSPHHLPDNISFDEGATLEPLASSLHAVKLARPKTGETIVILGLGIIGLGCVQIIKTTINCQIIAVDTSSKRLEMAKQLGANAVVNLAETDPVEAVIKLTGGAKPIERFGTRGGNADAVIDSAGARTSPNQGLTMLKQLYGRIIFVALFEHQPKLDFNQIVRKHVTIQGSWNWTGDEYREAITLVKNNYIDRKPLITHTLPLTEAPKAFAIQDQPDATIKVLLNP